MPRGLRLLVWAASAVIVLFGLRQVSSIAGPAFFALTLTVAVGPLRVWLRRKHARPWVLVVVPLATVLVIFLGLILATIISVARFAALVPTYAAQYQELLNWATQELSRLGITTAEAKQALSQLDVGKLVGLAESVLTSLVGTVSTCVVIVLLLYGLSMDVVPLERTVRGLRKVRPQLVDAMYEFAQGTCRYLVVSSVFGLIVAVLDTAALVILDVPLPLLWGLLAFITNFIPNVGFIIGLLPPALLGLLDSGPVTMLWVIFVYCVLNFVIQSVIQPKFTGRSAGLSTTITFLSLLVWTWALGAIGAILAVPLSAFVRALLLDADPNTSWASPLVSGVPAKDEG
ncbi:AI-2E family transporter [Nonomuraea sp. NBC_01738]|uniref:AI-2E family transporter n=1 Tax=Nonomuraea sp. NBC_01738 TaxID=2976003 RepID=UPI002E0FC3B6|nr:AI-2E family transporter [Nonomuraea sp. NBC_01738]